MITIKSKEDYLSWRTAWKNNYKILSQKIRDVKYARWFSDSSRGNVKMSEAQAQRFTQIAKEHADKYGFFNANYTLAELRAKATAMLEERKESKKLAQADYLTTRQPRSETAPATC